MAGFEPAAVHFPVELGVEHVAVNGIRDHGDAVLRNSRSGNGTLASTLFSRVYTRSTKLLLAPQVGIESIAKKNRNHPT